MDNSKGRYWDRPWSLVDGCTPCSPGCEHCWSAAMYHRFHPMRGPEDIGKVLTKRTTGQFFGEVKVRPERLDIPLRTRKPTVFSLWNDLFHEDVPDEFRDQALAVMALRPQHTFLLLSKRGNGMATYWNYKDDTINRRGRIQNQIDFILAMNHLHYDRNVSWPLPNVWHGITVCNQQEADEKIPELLKVPGKKWLSIEPMLGPISLLRWLPISSCSPAKAGVTFDAVILGGETGPGARPMHPDWVRSVRDQCQAAGVPFYLKQNGEWAEKDLPPVEKQSPNHKGLWFDKDGGYSRLFGYKPSDDTIWMEPVGSKRAGRLLDGQEHNELPWIK